MDKATSRILMLQYIREYTNKGQIIDPAKTADYTNGHDSLLDTVQKEVAVQIKIPAVFQITQNPIPNQIGSKGFDMKQYLPGEPEVITQSGTKSYYFEIDNIGTATIAVNGEVIKTIHNITKRAFTAYKGNTGANNTDTVTITFSGDYPYNFRNVAMYEYSFPTDDDVPEYTLYNEYPVPDDFFQFDTVIIKTDPCIYKNYVHYKWESSKKVILNRDDSGSFDIHYFKYPKTIEANAPDNTVLELEEKGAQLVPLKLAALVATEDKPDIRNTLLTMYESQMANIANDVTQGPQGVETVYSMDW